MPEAGGAVFAFKRKTSATSGNFSMAIDSSMRAHKRRGPAIGIIKTDDVILAQVSARLHFDDFQRLSTCIAQTMFVSWGDVSRFVFF